MSALNCLREDLPGLLFVLMVHPDSALPSWRSHWRWQLLKRELRPLFSVVLAQLGAPAFGQPASRIQCRQRLVLFDPSLMKNIDAVGYSGHPKAFTAYTALVCTFDMAF